MIRRLATASRTVKARDLETPALARTLAGQLFYAARTLKAPPGSKLVIRLTVEMEPVET